MLEYQWIFNSNTIMIPYKEISKLKGKTVKIKFVTHGNIENIMTVLMVDSRRGFKNDTIKVLVNGEMDYYIDTTKIISIKPVQNKVK